MNDQPKLPSLVAGSPVRAIVPQTMEEAYRMAKAVTIAGMAPPGLDTPERCMIAILHGMEVGITPMMSLQVIAVINKRPTIYGDGAIGLVRASGQLEWIEETVQHGNSGPVATCKVKRRNEPNVIVRIFSKRDAETAGLWGKRGRNGEPTPWITYPERMLAMRARAFALRDGFADILKGLGIAEEVRDIPTSSEPSGSYQPPPPPPPVPPSTPPLDEAAQDAADLASVAPVRDPREDEDFDPETGEIAEAYDEPYVPPPPPPPPANGGPKLTARAWLAKLDAEFGKARDLTDLAELQRTHMAPVFGKVSGEAWKIAQSIVERHVTRLQAAAGKNV